MDIPLYLVNKVKDAVFTMQLKSYVQNELTGLLESLGDINYNSAIASLHDAKRSNVPEREVAMAITHLQSAHRTFVLAVEKEENRWFRPDVIRQLDCSKKAFLSMFFIVVCYVFLEEKGLTTTYAKKLEDALRLYLRTARHMYYFGGNESDNRRLSKELNELDKSILDFCERVAGVSWYHSPQEIGCYGSTSTPYEF